jgi:uncharacterized DUF497 family protein
MMRSDFDWDADNLTHLAEHEVSPEEFEQVLENYPVDLDYQAVDGEDRILQIGTTNAARILTILSTVREGRIRPITAFPSSKRQIQAYFKHRS